MLAAALLVAAALALAGLTLLWTAQPQYDPQGWLLWGREVLGAGWPDTEWYPSWKPLGALLAVPVSLAGSGAPGLWLVVLRALALLSLVAAFRLGARLAGALAGLLAVAGVVLVPEWLGVAADGRLEALLLGLLAAAAERHLSGRRGQALVLVGLVALARVEAWPLLAAYALVVVREQPSRLALTALGLAAVPALWFGGDWLGSGDPLQGGQLAHLSDTLVPRPDEGRPGAYAAQLALGRLPAPLWVAAAAGAIVGGRRGCWSVPGLAAAGVAWLAVDVVLAARGYPADPRFMVPGAGLLVVAGAVGVVWTLELVARRRVRLAATALALGLLAAFWVAPAGRLDAQIQHTQEASELLAQVDHVVAAAGGRARLLAPGHLPIASNEGLATRLGWDLHVPSIALRRRCPPEIVFTYHDRMPNTLRRQLRRALRRELVRVHPLARFGDLDVLRIDPRRRAFVARAAGAGAGVGVDRAACIGSPTADAALG